MRAEVDTGAGQLSCCIYGIVPSGTTMPAQDDTDAGAAEIADRDFETLPHKEIAAVVEQVDAERTFGRRSDLLAHSALLNALAANGPVIPIAFGTVLADETSVVDDLLAPNHDHFVDVLKDLRDARQFTLRARYVQDQILAEVISENTEIVQLREATRDRSEEATHGARVRLGELVSHAVDAKRAVDAEHVIGELAPHAVDYRVTEGSGLEQLVDVSFLVSEGGRAEFEEHAEKLAEALHDRITLRLLGPLAAFDFVLEG